MYSYVPIPTKINRQDSFAGFIGKPVEESVNAGPEQLFALTKSKHYKASFVAIDVAEDQQMIAFEKRHDVGNSRNIIDAMLHSYIRDIKGFSWHSDVEYLSSKKDFWRAAKEHRGQITELSFEFYPPNGLAGKKAIKDFNTMVKEKTNSQTTKYSFKNPDGNVFPDGDFVEGAVEYASEGPGRITMKKGNKTLFNSRQGRQVKEVDESVVPRTGDSDRLKFLEFFDWLFGKKDG